MLNQFCWRNFSHRAWDWMKKKMIEKAKWKTWMKFFLSWRHWCPIELRSCCIHAQNWRNTMKTYVHSLCFSHFLFRLSHTHRDRETHSVFLLIIPFGIVKRNQFVLYNPDSYANTFNYTQNSISLYVVYCFIIANNESEKKRGTKTGEKNELGVNTQNGVWKAVCERIQLFILPFTDVEKIFKKLIFHNISRVCTRSLEMHLAYSLFWFWWNSNKVKMCKLTFADLQWTWT